MSGLRLRSRLMHDGKSATTADAIRRHKGEASLERKRFLGLSEREKKELRTFLESL